MTRAEHDQIVDALRAKQEADAKLKVAHATLLAKLPADGRSYALGGTPYYLTRTGDDVRITTKPVVLSLADLIQP